MIANDFIKLEHHNKNISPKDNGCTAANQRTRKTIQQLGEKKTKKEITKILFFLPSFFFFLKKTKFKWAFF